MANSLSLLSDPNAWAALATLIAMEVVLGIDNLIFISILTNKLPPERRAVARRIGIGLAVVIRLALLGTVAIIGQLRQPVFSLLSHGFSWRDLILIGGGLFLIWKATKEIHHSVDPRYAGHESGAAPVSIGMTSAIMQIVMLDIVFSLDSIITAVGMTDDIEIMIAANVVALALMLAVGGTISRFVERHPSVKMLALSFLLMIGFVLIAEGFSFHVPKGYIYGAMGFSIFVELLNLRTTRRTKSADPPASQ